MRKIFFLAALLSASIMSFADKVYDVNFALQTNGSSATASSGDASLAIDGNEGTRWESEFTDDETWTLDMGQARTFNYVRILWEGAYCSEFALTVSSDGENYQPLYTETAHESAGWQTIYFEKSVTARYVKYHGTKRATQWGQSFFEFQVYLHDGAPQPDIASGKSVVASSEGFNDVARVLDGNYGTEWQGSVTNGTEEDEESRTFDAWFVVDLGAFYNINQVSVSFEGACAQDYHIDFSADNETWVLGYSFTGVAGIYGRTDDIIDLSNNKKVRYVRFWSTKAATQWGMKVFEFAVYGTEWSGETTGMEEVPSDQVPSVKVLRNGQLIIVKDGVRYTAAGARVSK